MAALLQLPWGAGVLIWLFLLHVERDTSSGATVPTAIPGTPSAILIFSWPGLLGLVFGCYSVWSAGISRKNICGVLGLIFVGIEFLLMIYLADWSPKSATLRAAVLISVICVAIVAGWWRYKLVRPND